MKKHYTEKKEDRNILHSMKRRKANLIDHILRRNWFQKHFNERKERTRNGNDWKKRNKT
jgi:hypothetical protein